jgi:hypothetical protein
VVPLQPRERVARDVASVVGRTGMWMWLLFATVGRVGTREYIGGARVWVSMSWMDFTGGPCEESRDPIHQKKESRGPLE